MLNNLASAQNDVYKTITVDGRVRQYIIHFPPSYKDAGKLPVLFGLHGGGGTYEKTIRFYNLNDLADKNGFLVIYPNAIGKSWTLPGFAARSKSNDSTVDDVHFISVLLDTIIHNYKGDSTHIYSTGISRGGEFSLYLAYKLSTRIRAIAPVCANVPRSVLKQYTFSHPTPVLLINGTDDPLIKYDGGVGKYTGTDESSEGFDMASTDELINKMISLDSCNTNAQVTNMPDNAPYDGCTAIKYKYSGKGADVTLIKVINGGHTWPGGKQYLPKFLIGKVCRDFNAEEEIFDFLLAQK